MTVNLDVQFVTDPDGHTTSVLAPIELWREVASERETALLLPNDFGLTLFALGRLKEAKEELKRALHLNPKSGETYSNLCTVDIGLKEFSSAKSNAQSAVKLKPSDAHAWNNLGVANLKLKKYQEAAEALKKAVSLRPDNFAAHNNYGAAFYRLGKKNEATKEWKFVLKNSTGEQHDQAQDYLDHPEHS